MVTIVVFNLFNIPFLRRPPSPSRISPVDLSGDQYQFESSSSKNLFLLPWVVTLTPTTWDNPTRSKPRLTNLSSHTHGRCVPGCSICSVTSLVVRTTGNVILWTWCTGPVSTDLVHVRGTSTRSTLSGLSRPDSISLRKKRLKIDLLCGSSISSRSVPVLRRSPVFPGPH